MKELWLLTRQFPEGAGEAFLINALSVWVKHYERVVVIPMFNGKGLADLPPGVELRRLWDDPFRSLSATRTIAQAPRVLRVLQQRQGGAPFLHALSNVRQMLHKSQVVMDRLMPHYDPDRVAVLSSWMEDWVTVLGLVKERFPRLRFAAMAHGSDLYTERHVNGRIPFRASQMENVDRVICISRHGADYLHERSPAHRTKVAVAHMGTLDHGMAPWAPAEVLRIVSCAYLRAPKRVDQLARVLALVKRPVHWTHFGDGPGHARLHALVHQLPPHITADLKGNVSSAAITGWYSTCPVDLFMHLSGHEGVPVSMMEAISFGIPVWANDVGGVSELLVPPAGKLLPAGVGDQELASLLDGPGPAQWCDERVRQEVRVHWETCFSAERNFVRMMELMP